MATDLDLIILGGGCAGLSLALRLAEQPGDCRRVAVLETREAYWNDRSWCFWRLGQHRFDPLIKRSWSQVTVRSQKGTVQVDCARSPYQLLEARTFYDYATQRIAASAAVQLRLGATVLGPPQPVPGGWRIETSAGALTSARIIDTRPPASPRLGEAMLWQSFLGEELISDRAVFDPTRVELMDFASDLPGAVAFTYVLPITSDRALVETTLFDPQPRGPAYLAGRQKMAVERLLDGASCHVVRTEAGILPMGINRREAVLGRGYSRAGLMSGAARPATGYAFQRIQRWADGCSTALRNGLDPIGHFRDPLLTRFMDDLFLDVMRCHPERGPELFTRLFARTATPRIVRFLSDRASFLDRVAVAASLPTGLFLRQLLHAAPLALARPRTI